MVLEIQNLSFKYFSLLKDELAFALKNISLKIEEPSIIGIIGANGSGKSTLLKTILKINTPYSGKIKVYDKNISTMNRKEIAQNVAFLPQENSIQVNLRVIDIVCMGRYPYQNKLSFESSEDVEIALSSLDAVNMRTSAKKPYLTLSGGEKQRVLIARSLAQRAKILLLDEADAFLDIFNQYKLYELLNKLNKQKGLTIMLTTHNLLIAKKFCKKIILIKEGQIKHCGHPHDILTKNKIETLFDGKLPTDFFSF